MSKFTFELVNASGTSNALQVGDKGTVLITVRNTITSDATMVSTIEYSKDNGFHWDTLKTFSTVDGDFLLFDAPAGLYRARGVYTANSGTATTDYALMSEEYSSEKTRLVATLSAIQDSNVTNNDHIKFDTARGQTGANVILDSLTTYAKAKTLSSVGTVHLRPGRAYEVECTIPFAVFTDASGNTLVALTDEANNLVTTDLMILGTPAGGLVGTSLLISEFVAQSGNLFVNLLLPTGLTALGNNPLGNFFVNPALRITER